MNKFVNGNGLKLVRINKHNNYYVQKTHANLTDFP
jgi:hypothetical protein